MSKMNLTVLELNVILDALRVSLVINDTRGLYTFSHNCRRIVYENIIKETGKMEIEINNK